MNTDEKRIDRILVGVDFSDASRSAVKEAIESAKSALGKKGRLVIRKSGTEPLIRVMAEATDAKLMDDAVDTVADAVRSVI